MLSCPGRLNYHGNQWCIVRHKSHNPNQGHSQGGEGEGGRPPTQSFEKPFFQNVEIRVENFFGGVI